MKHVLYVGWIGFGNLGDELMWEVFRDLGTKYLNKHEYCLTPTLPKTDLNDLNSYDIVVLGGGSLITPHYVSVLQNAIRAGKEVAIWGSGHDWLDKARMEVLTRKKEHSTKRLVNRSFGATLVEVVEHAKYVGVRGPLTYEYLRQAGVNMDKVEISGDPGLLLKYENSINEEPEGMWPIGERVVALNWGTSYDRIYGHNEMGVEDQLVSVAKELIQQGYKIYVFAVWGKDQKRCARFYDKIDDRENVRMFKRPCRQNELMRIMRRCCFSINFKLHASVVSAVAGIPFIALGYRFKTFDFGASLNLQNLVVSTDSVNLKNEVMGAVRYIEKSKEAVVSRINRHQIIYCERLLSIFDKDNKRAYILNGGF